MKALITGALLTTFAIVAALVCSPVLTGTWIVKNKNSGMFHAVVVTFGIAESRAVVRIREVSAPREGHELYRAIHNADGISRSDGAPMNDHFADSMHWGGGQSWCSDEDCQRLYIFIGSSLRQHGT